MSESFPPEALFFGQSEVERKRTVEWWSGLGPESQAEFLRAFDSRADRTDLYGRIENGRIRWHELPIELRGGLIDEENDSEHRMFKAQLLEYISNHEDVQFFFVEKKLHICRAHSEARAAIQAGEIPNAFVCPLQDANCPMRRIVDLAGGAVTLTPVLLTISR